MFRVFRRLAGLVSLSLLVLSAAPAAEPPHNPDMEFPDGWFDDTGSAPATLTQTDAALQVNAVFDLVDRTIYDPQGTATLSAQARVAALEAVKTDPAPDQTKIGQAIETALQGMGMSHLTLLPPRIARKVSDATSGKSDGKPATSAVSARIDGDIGILRIDSFIVPLLKQTDLAENYAKLQKAKALLIDVTGNGGGGFSAVTAAAQPVLGPAKTIGISTFRTGTATLAPVEQYGALPDANNAGNGADIGLNMAHGTITWKTARDAPPPPARPVYLLIDGHCGSACEIFAGALKFHHAATLLGRQTMGKVLGGLAYRPPMKGYMLIVPSASVTGPGGEVYENNGVKPDAELPQCPAFADKADASSGAACLAAALAHIRG